MDKKQKYQSSIPLRNSFSGGFKKNDVTGYIEKIVSEVEAARAENTKNKEQIYDLMKNGQQFCDELVLQSQKKQKRSSLLRNKQRMPL